MAPTFSAAARELAAFVAELRQAGPAADPDLRGLTVDDAMTQFLDEHLAGEKGREERTITEYRRVHDRWFSPEIGRRRVRDVDEAVLDRVFGKMRAAGLSRSRLNLARSLYAPFFRWARSRRIITRNPMAEFQLPTSTYVSRERVPPEVAELSMLLREAVEAAPEIAPLLALGAVTGMRRGELVGLRRSRIRWDEQRLVVDTAMSGTRVKSTKTRRERSLYIDEATVAMLRRHCDETDERAVIVGAVMNSDPYVFTLALDGSAPMSPDYVTRRVGVLKGRLGIEEKKPDTVTREDEALRLFRQQPTPRPASAGPSPRGGISLREIGAALERSERWAALAIAAAERREAAGRRGLSLSFDGSILALRKFTSSELLDAGFNVSMVAQRQGHGPQVLVKHYAKSRRSSDRKAAEHLGRLVHETRNAGVPEPD
jgi:integrase